MNIAIIISFFTIVLSPLYIIRGKLDLPSFLVLPFPFTLLEIGILLSVLTTAVLFIKDKFPFQKLKTGLDIPILLFLLSATVSVFYSLDPIGGLGILKAYFIEPILFFYATVYLVRKKGPSYVYWGLFSITFFLCVLGLLQKTTGQFSLAPYEIAQGRISALYNSANSLSLFIGPISFLILAFFIQTKNRISKIGFLLFFVFCLLTIYWTKSRGGLISEVISLIIFVYMVLSLRIQFLKKIWYGIPLTVTFVIIFFLYQVFLTYDFIPYTYGQPYTQGDTLQIRFFIWTGTVNLLREHPVLGAGLNGFKTLYSNQYRLPQYQEQFQYPHNLLLTFWTETGLFGLFSFLLLLVSIFSLVIRNLLKSAHPVLGAGLLAGFSYWAIHGFVDVPYFKNDLSFLFWVFASLVVVWKSDFKKG